MTDEQLIEADAAALFDEVRAAEGLALAWPDAGQDCRRLYLAVARDPYRFAVALLRP